MKTLLSKTLTQFMLCTIVVFILSVPLFYLLTKHFYAEDMIDIIEAVEQGQQIPSLDLEADIITGMMIQFVLIFFVLSISLLITMRYITRKLWFPFDNTLRQTEQFNLAKSDIPNFMDTNIVEFARLNHSLSTLMKKDIETFQIQKEFTENASHELQTPLTIIRNKLDLLLQGEMNEEQLKLVEDMYSLTTRMRNLNKDLLLLAKIENAQFFRMNEMNVKETIDMAITLYGVVNNQIKLKFVDQRDDVNKTIKANSTLLECVVKNLIVNAIRHSDGCNEIAITLNDKGFTVSNKSSNNLALNKETIFQRFNTGDSHKEGNGLGLAIVKAICDFHKWSITYEFSEGNNRFIIRFDKETTK